MSLQLTHTQQRKGALSFTIFKLLCSVWVQVMGHIEKDGVRLQRPVIRGNWDAELVADLADGTQKTLFRINPPPAEPDRCAQHVHN